MTLNRVISKWVHPSLCTAFTPPTAHLRCAYHASHVNRGSCLPRMSLPSRRPPPHAAARGDHEQVPDEGNGDVVDAIRHMLEFALELLGTGHLNGVVDSEYVQSLHWYKSLPAVLAGNTPR